MLPVARVTYRRPEVRAGHGRRTRDETQGATHAVPFLSDEWIAEAHEIRAEYKGKTQPIAHTVRMNLVVTEVPFGDGHTTLDAHMDTTLGRARARHGHIDEQDLKVTVDYATAKAILVEGNPQAGMQAFMAGKVRVEGDMAKLMALTTSPGAGAGDNANEFAERLRAITS